MNHKEKIRLARQMRTHEEIKNRVPLFSCREWMKMKRAKWRRAVLEFRTTQKNTLALAPVAPAVAVASPRYLPPKAVNTLRQQVQEAYQGSYSTKASLWSRIKNFF